MANVKIYKCIPHIFVLALTISEKYKFCNLLSPKSGSWSQSAIFAITQFDCKCQNLQISFFTLLIFAMVSPVLTILTHARERARTNMHTYTHTHRNRQASGFKRILQICLESENVNVQKWLVAGNKLWEHCLKCESIDCRNKLFYSYTNNENIKPQQAIY